MIHSFPPIVDGRCRVLVLGSMPSAASLARRQYYAHAQNCFWPLLFQLFEEPYSDDYAVRQSLLLRHHIALWDVLASCEREGSLDSSIRAETPNDLPALLARYPAIRHLAFNGGKAFQSCRRHFPSLLEMDWIRLPSTSPAYTMRRDEKAARWRILRSLCGED